jgi:REP element-mobilizing transposase RayT
MVLQEWRRSRRLRGDLELDALIIMPDHVHAIVWIGSGQGRARATGPTTIPRFMQHFKSATARRINRHLGTPGSRVWEHSYWERRVRDARALAAIRAYIRDNPLKWWLGPKKPRRRRL